MIFSCISIANDNVKTLSFVKANDFDTAVEKFFEYCEETNSTPKDIWATHDFNHERKLEIKFLGLKIYSRVFKSLFSAEQFLNDMPYWLYRITTISIGALNA